MHLFLDVFVQENLNLINRRSIFREEKLQFCTERRASLTDEVSVKQSKNFCDAFTALENVLSIVPIAVSVRVTHGPNLLAVVSGELGRFVTESSKPSGTLDHSRNGSDQGSAMDSQVGIKSLFWCCETFRFLLLLLALFRA